MLLPELNIPVSIEIFESHVERFIRGYVTSDQFSFGYEKKDFINGGYRLSIFFYQKEPDNSSSNKIGEIDLLIVNPQKVNINASVLNIEKIKEGIDFFNDFYFMVFDKWEVTPFSDDFWNGKGVVERTIFNIASSNDIIKMFLLNGNLDVFPSYENYKIMKFAFSMISDDTYSLSHPEYKEKIFQYQLEINKALPEISQVIGSIDEKNNFGAQDKSEDISSVEKPYLPKTDDARERWRKSWKIICEMRKEEVNPDDPESYEIYIPKLEDFIERIKFELKKSYSERHIRRIINAGEAGLLD